MFSLYRSNKCLSSILLHKTEHIFATNVCFLKNAVLLCSYDYSRFGGNNMSEGNITPKQKEILEYIKDQILTRGFPPAVREICEAVNLKSTSSVHSHLETLEKNGYIRRDPTKPRAIEILDDNFNLTRREMVNIPIIGRVAAGEPLLAEQNIEDYFPIPVEYRAVRHYDHPPGGQKTGNEPGITHFGPCWPEVWKGGIHHRKETGQTEFSKAGADGEYRGQSPRTGGTGRAFPRTVPTPAV